MGCATSAHRVEFSITILRHPPSNPFRVAYTVVHSSELRRIHDQKRRCYWQNIQTISPSIVADTFHIPDVTLSELPLHTVCKDSLHSDILRVGNMYAHLRYVPHGPLLSRLHFGILYQQLSRRRSPVNIDCLVGRTSKFVSSNSWITGAKEYHIRIVPVRYIFIIGWQEMRLLEISSFYFYDRLRGDPV